MTDRVLALAGSLVNQSTRGLAVVAAPHIGILTAWIQTARGWRILDRSPDRQHVLDDARRYAARFGLSVRVQSRPLDATEPGPSAA